MEYIIIAGQFIKWVLFMIILMTLISLLSGGTIRITESEGAYGIKTTEIKW